MDVHACLLVFDTKNLLKICKSYFNNGFDKVALYTYNCKIKQKTLLNNDKISIKEVNDIDYNDVKQYIISDYYGNNVNCFDWCFFGSNQDVVVLKNGITIKQFIENFDDDTNVIQIPYKIFQGNSECEYSMCNNTYTTCGFIVKNNFRIASAWNFNFIIGLPNMKVQFVDGTHINKIFGCYKDIKYGKCYIQHHIFENVKQYNEMFINLFKYSKIGNSEQIATNYLINYFKYNKYNQKVEKQLITFLNKN